MSREVLRLCRVLMDARTLARGQLASGARMNQVQRFAVLAVVRLLSSAISLLDEAHNSPEERQA